MIGVKLLSPCQHLHLQYILYIDSINTLKETNRYAHNFRLKKYIPVTVTSLINPSIICILSNAVSNDFKFRFIKNYHSMFKF